MKTNDRMIAGMMTGAAVPGVAGAVAGNPTILVASGVVAFTIGAIAVGDALLAKREPDIVLVTDEVHDGLPDEDKQPALSATSNARRLPDVRKH